MTTDAHSTSRRDNPIILQTPPEVIITISGAGNALIKCVTTGRMPRWGSVMKYDVNREYWADTTKMSWPTGDLKMEFRKSTPETTGLNIDNEFNEPTFIHRFNNSRIPGTWTTGVRQVPADREGYLYRVDQDFDGAGSRKPMGVLIEIDRNDKSLKAFAWYKTWVPIDGYVAEQFPTVGQDLRRMAGTHPYYISNGDTWSYILMGSP